MKKYIILLMLIAGCSNNPEVTERLKVGECFHSDTPDQMISSPDFRVLKVHEYGMTVKQLKTNIVFMPIQILKLKKQK